LLWNKFMANPEIAPMLEQTGFISDPYGIVEDDENLFELSVYPNPSGNETIKVKFFLPSAGEVHYRITNLLGVPVVNCNKSLMGKAGVSEIIIQASDLKSGMYLLTLTYNNHIAETVKLMIN
ncbi:MAG: T9SS type A sorting domain-containing protein, partial [Lentimicrobium sp.]|nr:T9SS type A sorting domain-containing protein [Lentimicrobium sp.]